MFGRAYFGGAYYGPRYWGDGGSGAPPPPPAVEQETPVFGWAGGGVGSHGGDGAGPWYRDQRYRRAREPLPEAEPEQPIVVEVREEAQPIMLGLRLEAKHRVMRPLSGLSMHGVYMQAKHTYITPLAVYRDETERWKQDAIAQEAAKALAWAQQLEALTQERLSLKSQLKALERDLAVMEEALLAVMEAH